MDYKGQIDRADDRRRRGHAAEGRGGPRRERPPQAAAGDGQAGGGRQAPRVPPGDRRQHRRRGRAASCSTPRSATTSGSTRSASTPSSSTLLKQLIKEDRTGVVLVAAPQDDGHDGRALRRSCAAHDAFLEHLHTVERDPESEMEGITQNKLAGQRRRRPRSRRSSSWVISQEPDAIMVTKLDDPKAANELVKFAKEKRVYVGIRAGSAFEALNQWRKLVGNDKLAVSEPAARHRRPRAAQAVHGVQGQLRARPRRGEQARPQPGQGRPRCSRPARSRSATPRATRCRATSASTCATRAGMGVYETLVVDDDMRAVVAGGGSDNQLKAVVPQAARQVPPGRGAGARRDRRHERAGSAPRAEGRQRQRAAAAAAATAAAAAAAGAARQPRTKSAARGRQSDSRSAESVTT